MNNSSLNQCVFRGTAIALLLACIGEPALPAQAGAANTKLAGIWQYDAAASDDYAARITQLIAEQRKRWRARMPRRLTEAERATQMPDEPPLEADERVRGRLEETMKPAQELAIALQDGDIEISADGEPTRSLTPGRTLARMDSSGTAQITAQWSGPMLIVRARYTHRATRAQQYSVDRRNDLLRVKLQVSDPSFGRMELQSVYRRKPPAT